MPPANAAGKKESRQMGPCRAGAEFRWRCAREPVRGRAGGEATCVGLSTGVADGGVTKPIRPGGGEGQGVPGGEGKMGIFVKIKL